MSNNLDELFAAEVFIKVVDCGSFVEAAKVLQQNPSTISRTVAQLEQHLGEQLLRRTTRKVSITEAGQVYKRHALHMLEARSHAREALQGLRGGKPRGTLRVTMPVVMGEQLLAQHLHTFRALYPEIELQIDLSNKNAAIVQEGLDLAVRVGPMVDSNLRAQRVGGIVRKLYASPAYLQQHGTPQHPQDLVHHACVAFIQAQALADWQFWQRANPQLPPYSLPMRAWLACSSPTMLLDAMQQGLGVGRSAEWMCAEAVKRGHLVELLPQYACDPPGSGGVPVYLVYPPGPAGLIPLKTRALADFLLNTVFKGLHAQTRAESELS